MSRHLEGLRSLGFHTDLMLLSLGGSQVKRTGDHLITCAPHNPTFWWDNFLLHW